MSAGYTGYGYLAFDTLVLDENPWSEESTTGFSIPLRHTDTVEHLELQNESHVLGIHSGDTEQSKFHTPPELSVSGNASSTAPIEQSNIADPLMTNHVSTEFPIIDNTWKCIEYCKCPLRQVLNLLGVTYDWEPLMSKRNLYCAMNLFIGPSPVPPPDKLMNLSDRELVLFQHALHSIMLPEGSNRSAWYPNFEPYFRQYKSWARKIARDKGAFAPRLFLEQSKYRDLKEIAGGGGGYVYRDLSTHSNGNQVVKFIRSTDPALSRKRLCQEVMQWYLFEHPNIVPFYGLREVEGHPSIGIVSAFMKNGDVMAYLRAHPETNDHYHHHLLYQSCSGLEYLHKNEGATHGDIRGENILVNDNGEAMLADFGLTTVSEAERIAPTASTQYGKGTTRWMAPELCKEGKNNHATDLYAFGMTILQVLTHELPYSTIVHDVQVLMEIVKHKLPARPRDARVTEGMWALIQRCCNMGRPEKRLSAEEIKLKLEILMMKSRH